MALGNGFLVGGFTGSGGGGGGGTGPQGPPGPQGPAGATGAQGPAGPQGPVGPTGPAGTGVDIKGSVPTEANLPSSGNTTGDGWITQDTGHLWVWDGTKWVDAGTIVGPPGPAGPQGPIGATGPQGPAGATGSQGLQGPAGATGAQGPPGTAGATGSQGPAGPAGATGATGSQGPAGPTGPAGAPADLSNILAGQCIAITSPASGQIQIAAQIGCIQTPWIQPVNAANNAIYNLSVVQFAPTGQIYPSSAAGNAMIIWGGTGGTLLRAPAGVSTSATFAPAYPLDVVGNVNSSGCYLIGGVAFACSDGAGGINLSNVTNINGAAPGGTPAPPTQSVQWNNNGVFGGSANLLWNNSNSAMTLAGGGNSVVLQSTSTVIQFYSTTTGISVSCPNQIQLSGSNILCSGTSTTGNAFRVSASSAPNSIVVTSAGYIGVGTATPAFPVDIVSSQSYIARINSTGSFSALVIDHNVASGGESVISFRSAGSENALIQYDSNENSVTIWTGASGSLKTTLCCDANSRVGILTATPAYELDVVGDVNSSGCYRINGNAFACASGSQIALSNIATINGAAPGGGFWQAGSGGAIYYNGGNVGIGTTSPIAKLYITGSNSSGGAGAPTYRGTFVIDEYFPSLAGNGGIEFMSRADSGGFGWRISSLANAVDLVFESRIGATWTERMRILNGGNVGIGTASPANRLVVVGPTGTSGGPTLGGTTGSFALLGGADNPTWGLYFGAYSSGNSWLQAQRNDGNGSAYSILLNPAGGNVGIGTTSPGNILSVTSSASIDGINITCVNRASVYLNSSTAAQGNWLIQTNVSASGDLQVLSSATAGGAATASRMTMTMGGNVGIGTTSPQVTLDVAGTTRIYSAASPSIGVLDFGIYGASISYNGSAWVFNPAISGGGITVMSDVTASRAVNTAYTNSFSTAMYVFINLTGAASLNINGGGLPAFVVYAPAATAATLYGIVMPGQTYTLAGVSSFTNWREYH